MLNADVTLRRVIWELNEWASSHGMIEKFMGYGQFLQTQMESERSYPLMVVNVTSAPSENWYINYQFEIMVLDWVGDEQTNRPRVMSDTRQILNDLEETISYSNRWQDFSKIKGAINCIPAIEKGRDKSFGWILTFTLGVKKRHGICDLAALMPEYDFEQGVVVPSCNPVTSTLNTMPITPTPSGGNKAVTLVDTFGDPFTDFIKTVDTASSLEIEIDAICAPCGVDLNGTPLTDIDSGDTKTMTITYANGDPVTITTVTDTDIAFDGTIPDLPTPNNSLPINSGAYILGSFNSNDDADINFGKGGAAAPFYLLEEENPFGNFFAFTGKTGGYQSHVDNLYYDKDGVPTTEALAFPDDVVLVWKSRKPLVAVLAIIKTPLTSRGLRNHLNDAPYTYDSKSDWQCINKPVGNFIENQGVFRDYFNYPPFNHTMSVPLEYVWSSYIDDTGIAFAFTPTGYRGLNINNQYRTYVYRLYTWAELGL